MIKRTNQDFLFKDLGHFLYQNAHGKNMSCTWGINAHILILHGDKSISPRIDFL